MRVKSKTVTNSGLFRPKYFQIKRDRKTNTVVIVSPKIDWNLLTDTEKKIQWICCTNLIWDEEKHNNISKDHLENYLKELLKKLGYNNTQIYNFFKTKDIPLVLYSTAFLVLTGNIYKPPIQTVVFKIKHMMSKLKEFTLEQPKNLGSIKDSPVFILIGKIQDLEDNIFKNKINFKDWLKENNVTQTQALQIEKFYLPRLHEVYLLYKGTDEQLNEAYRKLTKKQISYMVNWYADLIKSLKLVENTIITKTRIRKSKPKTPDKIVKKIKYLESYNELGLKSISPQKIIGSTTLWVYNVKLRKLLAFHAKEGYTLTVEGSCIRDFDEKLSLSKTLRKPEVQLKEFLDRGKKPMLDYFSKINSKESPNSGRINRDMVLLKVF